ncbi:MAG: OmpA family protein, partial [Flavobacteriales bacterium]|nr:OmpA family protein [Flavobacteriales bacterium]
MKHGKIVLIAMFLIIGINSNAQDLKNLNQWSLGLQLGGHDAPRPISTTTKFFTHVNGDVRYMVNNRFGLMADMGYENFAWKTDTMNNTHITRFSLQGVLNMGDILRFNTWTDRFGLLVHGGAGISNMWQKGRFNFGEGDVMGNFIAGITPQYMVTDRFSVNLDWSMIFHGAQDNHFDFQTKTTRNGVNGFYMTASVGVSVYLGKNNKHADWAPSEFGGGTDQGLIDRITALENQLKDDDNDGV